MVILCQVNVASVKEPEAALRGPGARPPADRAPGEQAGSVPHPPSLPGFRQAPPLPHSHRRAPPRGLPPLPGPPRRSHSTPNVTDKEAKRVGREHQPPRAERPAKGPECPTRPAPTLIQGSEKGTLAPLYDPTGTEAGVRLGPTSRQHNSKKERQPAGPSPGGQTDKVPHPHAERRGKEARTYPATPTSHAGRSVGKAREQGTRRDSTDGTRPEQASPRTPRAQWVGSDHYRVHSFFWGQVMGMFRNETELVGAQHCGCAKCHCIVEY
ncbi:proline-rich proteoglycan 2-like [Acinonyx jubatus]|uniref:Proline-rich proteoglycan 2-like n=1 Tax=Acinonyx jubatus TaxID=32536 RepID=A0A6J1Y274_ACIJB|nr:proline-rich proteoglycan 2-like [Acinonyx jubatus]XP_053069410.1 proline-rich proteoglycan 2-like [Acinonyx jubatus]